MRTRLRAGAAIFGQETLEAIEPTVLGGAAGGVASQREGASLF